MTVVASLKATIGHGAPLADDEPGDPLTNTMPAPTRRTTVLPRRKVAAGAAAERARFDRVKTLGQGGMGEVALARDNDIPRTVAVKYLRPEFACSEAALMRFADEVRVVGQLEHPAIVPVYDVGVDDQGKHFLVMKHLEGETMESIIQKLRAGDPDTCARFTIEYRAHLFLQVLEAIRYAHSRDIVHRDLKPANIMIGPYGEVTVMDWGIAKPIRRGQRDRVVSPLAHTLKERGSNVGRLLQTEHGALAGTPLYMSREQAAGRNDEIDGRSDVYTLGVVLLEWLALFHPLEGKTSLTEVLGSIALNDYDDDVCMRAIRAGAPVEYAQLAFRAIKRDRDLRLQSVDEFEKQLRDILDGNVLVKCHVTLAKRGAYAFTHWIDRNPLPYTLLFYGGGGLALVSMVGALAWAVYRACS